MPERSRAPCDLDVLCGIAIIIVLAQHLPIALSGPPVSDQRPSFVYFGFWFGTDLLLAVAGFLAAREFSRRLETAGSLGARVQATCGFWLGCARRVAPLAALWLAAILACTLAFNRSGVFGTPDAAFMGVLAAFLNVENLRLALAGPAAATGATYGYWAVSLIAQFCLILPLVLFFCRPRLWVLLAAAIAFQLVQPRTPWSLAGFLRTDALLLGALVAVWARGKTWRLFEPVGLQDTKFARFVLPTLLVCLLAALCNSGLVLVPFTTGLVAILAGVLVWLASYDRGYLLPDGVLKRMLAWAGSRALGLYLAHIPAFLATREIWFRLHPGSLSEQPPHQLRFVVTGLALVVLLGELGHRLLEAPLARLGTAVTSPDRLRQNVGAQPVDAECAARAEPVTRDARASSEEWIS
jgi:peptidoglycan/LPS O-acetylase OafA/YrhL